MKKILFALLAIFVLAAGFVNAYPALVTGTVYYSDGTTPLVGADVTVVCEHAGYNSTDYTVSVIGGTYISQFLNIPDMECTFGDKVWVTAEYNDMTGEATGKVCAVESECPIPVAVIDVTIPEFGVLAAGVALIGALGIFAIKRKD